MYSRVASESKAALLRTCKQLSPEQRLNALLAHCRAMAQLRQAGERARAAQRFGPVT